MVSFSFRSRLGYWFRHVTLLHGSTLMQQEFISETRLYQAGFIILLIVRLRQALCGSRIETDHCTYRETPDRSSAVDTQHSNLPSRWSRQHLISHRSLTHSGYEANCGAGDYLFYRFLGHCRSRIADYVNAPRRDFGTVAWYEHGQCFLRHWNRLDV
ncbi:hypothetical protein M426DRAFT_169099 [Hypoxylon sp. CI-4A]|nr:hypothetical protein M426DRAFT_169099 [Hypoxylon sp. CI-4A]